MLNINDLIVVEGKYDKEKLKKVTNAPVICTNGFDVYRSDRIIKSIKALSKGRGVIILTDSDRAGFRIRNYLKQCLGEEVKIRNAYIPEVKGKEKRKDKAGADGILGVEGIDEKTLEEILAKASFDNEYKELVPVLKSDFYKDGFSGKADSSDKRKELAKILGLPPRISANGMLQLINSIYGKEEYKEALKKMKKYGGQV